MTDFFTQLYGADAFDDPCNYVDGIFKPRKRIARDSARFMDAAAGHRPGYRLADDGELTDAANDAYAKRSQRLANAWRKDRQDDAARDHEPPTLDQCRQAADTAYEDRKTRLANAWRSR